MLQLEFEDCFEEHHKAKTYPALYQVLGIVFKYTKFIIYHFFVVILGIPIMFLWALLNGMMTFGLVWIWGPALRMFVVLAYSVAPALYVPVQAVFSPIIDVQARIFRQCVIQAKVSGGLKTSREQVV